MAQTLKELQQIQDFLHKHDRNETPNVLKDRHENYMKTNLHSLGKNTIFFDYGQPWIYYYILNTCSLLGRQIPKQDIYKIVDALSKCWSTKNGGFGGGYMQIPHLAPTYASVLGVILIGQPAYHLLDREGLTKFILSCKKDKVYEMTDGAETDLRAAYIVTIIVKLLHLDEGLLEGVAETIISSQTYEGGLSNVKGGQAHGGYTFCGIAALSLLGKLHLIDVPRLTYWLSRRQCEFGGFNGRTNKLLDSCYSFWVGAIFNIVNNYFGGQVQNEGKLIYSQEHLQQYITFYCQDSKGGLRDKPSKNRDIYHTCYALTGLALSQQSFCLSGTDKLQEVDPIYGVNKRKLEEARQFFSK